MIRKPLFLVWVVLVLAPFTTVVKALDAVVTGGAAFRGIPSKQRGTVAEIVWLGQSVIAFYIWALVCIFLI